MPNPIATQWKLLAKLKLTSEELKQMLSQAKSASDVIFESSNVVQEDENYGSIAVSMYYRWKQLRKKSYSSLFEIYKNEQFYYWIKGENWWTAPNIEDF